MRGGMRWVPFSHRVVVHEHSPKTAAAKRRCPKPDASRYLRRRLCAVTLTLMDIDSHATDGAAERARELSVVARKGYLGVQTPFANSPRARKRFIELVSEGATIAEAARRVGTSGSGVAHLRTRDSDFDAAVLAAIELGAEPVLSRLRDIALAGAPEDAQMTNVRAAEIYLKGTNQAYRLPDNRKSEVKLTRTTADGETYTLSASANGIPD